ncbi:MAG TPA: hypothetical protein VLT36_17265 [Candidatus Dormibacteraeota bacterium]|nr:hypothetical protein [Candidatus Dormibacteraeota bacterium]
MEQCSVYAAKRLDELFPERARRPKESVERSPGKVEAVLHSDGASPSVAADHNKSLALKDVNPLHLMIQKHGLSVDPAKRFAIGFFPGRG